MSVSVKVDRVAEHRIASGVLDLSIAPDAGDVAVACMNGVYRLSLESGESERLYRHQSYVSSVAWVREGLVLSAGYDGAVQWYDPVAGKTLRESKLHEFWSWDMAVSRDEKLLASVTGQYLAGGYKYEPAAEVERSLKVVSIENGTVLHEFSHVPSVQSVAISDDNRFVAAGNLMGEIRVFDLNEDAMVANWTTDQFTSWGVIKSHCYLGGIFSMEFTPDGDHLLLAGMGPMKDPMAGNGKQRWQKWEWSGGEPTLVTQTRDEDAGEGLMETLAIHPDGAIFAMGGRLRGGDWNVALFDLESGHRLAHLKTGYRVTQARFTSDGSKLVLGGAQGQPKKTKDGQFPPFGRVEVYELLIQAG